MRLSMIIFIACLSYSKSIELLNPSTKYLNASKIPVIGKYFGSKNGNATPIDEAPEKPPPTESPQDAYVNVLKSNEEIKTTIGNDLLKIISEPESDEPNEAVEETVNSLSNLEYWEPVTSKLQYVWDKLKQLGRYAAKTLRKATSYIGKKVKHLRVYMNQGREIVETLHNAVKSAGKATEDSDEPTVQNINNFFARLVYILKNFKQVFKTNPIEIARDRESLAE
ncbi:uncharacterized protein LOC106662717 isoform X1 [Cimex lectularius]|uniref:Uncharacterized protein n=1 Tax=Cimex lectularius TaxID=79782 RepID=A0A8I6RAQ7_CIMLE|nr:uncharacterized protein LOC106662717 isoform X1 [Cimex lectularius]